ncbi:MAG: DUF5694 domain-containing protein [Bacteroidota bacterium]
MKRTIAFFLSLLFVLGGRNGLSAQDSLATSETAPVEVLLLGTLHFNQFHRSDSSTRDFLRPQRQAEFAEVVRQLVGFQADQVFIERERGQQARLDSLYRLAAFDPRDLSDGLSEVYQIGFPLARQLQLAGVVGIDHYESHSQGLLAAGEGYERFRQDLVDFQDYGRQVTQEFLQGRHSIRDFLRTLNLPENVARSHRLFYNTPAYVTAGSFRNYDGLDSDQIDTEYIGAEFIALFYERNLKIYSNLLRSQMETGARRIVVIIGQTHVGVLQDLLENNPHYKIVPAGDYLGD